MRTLRGGNSNLQNEKSKSKSEDSEDFKDAVDDDDVGANGDETTDDEGGVDTPPPPREEDEDSKSEEKPEIEDNKDKVKNESTTNEEKEGEYEVEQIVDMQVQKRRRCPVQFRIRWLGFTEKDDTWVPASDLNCDELVQDFLEISGRKSAYEKAFESKKRLAESSVESYRQSARKTTKITYSELDEDQDEILPSGTRTRKIKTKAEKKQMPNFTPVKKKKMKKKEEGNSAGTKGPKKEKQFEVEKIVDHRVRGRFTDYKIRWKGYSTLHDSWIAESDLNCPNLVKTYNKKVYANAMKEEQFEVEAIAGMRETKGRVEYKVRWKNWGPKYDSWLPEEELNCPEILNNFKRTLEKLEKQEDWQVEKILDSRDRRGKTEFLIHWKGFESKFDSWEPKENLKGCRDLLDSFVQQKGKEKEKLVKSGRKTRIERPRPERFAENFAEEARPRSKRKSNVTSYSEDD